jgi:hypothetical protein
MKQPYLVVYDYDTGGIWAVIYANSPEQILAKYPELKIMEPPPDWMVGTKAREIAESTIFDIDDNPPEWLVLAHKKST